MAAKWTLEVIRGNGQFEPMTVPLPTSYFLEEWGLVKEAAGPWASVRLVSDDGHVLTPLGGDGPVGWWRVEPAGVTRPSLRGAFDVLSSS